MMYILKKCVYCRTSRSVSEKDYVLLTNLHQMLAIVFFKNTQINEQVLQ